MELCTAQGTSNLPLLHPKHFSPRYGQSQSTIYCRTQLSFIRKQLNFNAGLRDHWISSLRSSVSEGASTDTSATSSYGGGVTVEEDKSFFPNYSQPAEETDDKEAEVKVEDKSDSDGGVKLEDTQTIEKTEDKDTQVVEDKGDPEIKVEVTKPVGQTEDKDIQVNGTTEEVLSLDMQPLYKLLEDFDIKLDEDDKYPVIALGGGALVALWILASVVRAIDYIPLLPKVLELIGIGYSIWFSYRNLIFKEKRDELVARIEQIKQNVIG